MDQILGLGRVVFPNQGEHTILPVLNVFVDLRWRLCGVGVDSSGCGCTQRTKLPMLVSISANHCRVSLLVGNHRLLSLMP